MPLAELRLRSHQAAAYRIPSALGRLPAPSVFEARVGVTCCGSLYLMLLSGCAPLPSSHGTELTWQTESPCRACLCAEPYPHLASVPCSSQQHLQVCSLYFSTLTHTLTLHSQRTPSPSTSQRKQWVEFLGLLTQALRLERPSAVVHAAPPRAAACLLSPFLRVSFCWLASPSSVLSPLASISSHSYFPVQFLKVQSFKAITLQVPPHSLSCHTCPLPLLHEGGRWAWTPLCPS